VKPDRSNQSRWSWLLLTGATALVGCKQGAPLVSTQTEVPAVEPSPSVTGTSPLSTTYWLDGRVVSLMDGTHDEAAAPDSAARNTTVVRGAPVAGDLDQDGDDDAVVILVNEPGGSGTFYYVAVAELDRNRFNGSAAVLIGDRIALQNVAVENGIVTVNLVERAGDSLVAAPSEAISRRYTYMEDELQELEAPAAGEVIVSGWVVVGHEARSLRSCAGAPEFWLEAPADTWADLRRRYEDNRSNTAPYTPVFAVLAGRVGPRPTSEFGSSYERSFRISAIWRVAPSGECG
jgi:hypothetical protein